MGFVGVGGGVVSSAEPEREADVTNFGRARNATLGLLAALHFPLSHCRTLNGSLGSASTSSVLTSIVGTAGEPKTKRNVNAARRRMSNERRRRVMVLL